MKFAYVTKKAVGQVWVLCIPTNRFLVPRNYIKINRWTLFLIPGAISFEE